jgi:hypothetical protein
MRFVAGPVPLRRDGSAFASAVLHVRETILP